MENRVQRSLGFLLLAWIAPVTPTIAADCIDWAARIVSVQGTIEGRSARISTDVSGQVSGQIAGNTSSHISNWYTLNRNDTLCHGDSIRTGEHSRAAIVLANETLLRLDQNSVIKLTQFKKNQPSILQFILGIGHFISRVPRSLKIETATVNAAIEGTEFVLEVSPQQTRVSVFEGRVLTHNNQGELRITDGETSISYANAAPFKTLLARPRDSVQWALYFPPINQTDKETTLNQASRLLATGRSREAEELLQGIDSGESLALQSIIAIVQNDNANAENLATEALRKTPQSAAAHLAMSYIWQAKLQLNSALASAQQAVELEPQNALAWARLAELQLSTGQLDTAMDSAQQATEKNARLSRTQSVAGFAQLLQSNITEATVIFNKAIELDQTDPLPHLGLGLTLIRRNQLAKGRREIEIAASLDPDNAIIRSYLGKAYFEEKRTPLDADQFAMAKALDPNDPTPWFYDAIRKQTTNNPAGALEDINQSIRLNDNRAIYRSSMQLDQDEAARYASQARIYQDLHFDQLALNQAYLSLNQNPDNFSAHRYLADAYSKMPRHDIALASELLQSQLTQPSIVNPPRPQLLSAQKNILSDNRVSSSFNEYAALFSRDGVSLLLDSAIASNKTYYDNFILSGDYNIHSFSLSQYHYETDGYRVNNDYTQDIADVSYQLNLTPNNRLIFSYTQDDTIEGDINQSIIADSEITSLRREEDNQTGKIGYSHNFNSQHRMILSAVHQQRDVQRTKSSSLDLAPDVYVIRDSTRNIDYSTNAAELQLSGKVTEKVHYTFGVGAYLQHSLDEDEIQSTLFVSGTPMPSSLSEINLDYDIKHQNAYLYTNINFDEAHTLILGLSADHYEDTDTNALYENNIVNPKIGYIYTASKNTHIKLAAFQALKRALISRQTIEPTQIAGFNQYFDDLNGADARRYGMAIDHAFNSKMSTGLELSKREVNSPSETVILNDIATAKLTDRDEEVLKTYLYWVATPDISLGISPWVENQKRSFTEGFADETRPNKINTRYIPLNISFNHKNGFSSRLSATYIDQEVEFPALTGVSQYTAKAWLLNADVSYRLPDRFGKISFSINNITDESELFQDSNLDGEPRQTTFLPETGYQLNFVVSF